jgi:hypothetical protein
MRVGPARVWRAATTPGALLRRSDETNESEVQVGAQLSGCGRALREWRASFGARGLFSRAAGQIIKRLRSSGVFRWALLRLGETAGRGSGLQPICPISLVVLRLHPLPVSMTAVWTCAPSSRPAARSFQVSTPRSPNFKSQTDSFHRPPLAPHRPAHSPPTPILTV